MRMGILTLFPIFSSKFFFINVIAGGSVLHIRKGINGVIKDGLTKYEGKSPGCPNVGRTTY